MKQFKKIIICLLAVLALAGGQATYVSAATESEASMLGDVAVNVTKGSVGVDIIFNYSDGNNVNYAYFIPTKGGDSYNFSVTHNSFSNDTRTVIVTATNRYSGAKVTLGAWCDIYGQTGSF